MKYTEKTVRFVDYADLDEAISNFFKKEYESAAMEEWDNDSCYTFQVSREVNIWDLHIVDEFNKGNPQPYGTGSLLNYICNAGEIEPGEYIVEVSW